MTGLLVTREIVPQRKEQRSRASSPISGAELATQGEPDEPGLGGRGEPRLVWRRSPRTRLQVEGHQPKSDGSLTTHLGGRTVMAASIKRPALVIPVRKNRPVEHQDLPVA